MGQQVKRLQVVNCHHNYTVRSQAPDGQPIWLSRKGAIDASKGTWGLIPGSMGDKSYVVVGKGNPDSLNSAPHGAGRNFSRSAAKKEFTLDDLNNRMRGIVWGESANFLDEHPLAYKSIDQVMDDAEDLVKVKHELNQFLNVKGN
jgi:tRNA-splicing ligase RtcB